MANNYKSIIQNNNMDLSGLLETINNLPEAGTDLPSLSQEGSAADLLSGKQLIDSSGAIVTGTMPQKTANDLTTNGATVTVPAGHYATQATKSVTTATRAETTISSTKNNNAIVITASNNQATGYVAGSNKTATTTVSLEINGATAYITDGTTQLSQTVASGKALTPATTITSNPTVSIDANGKITASNSKTQSVTPSVTAGYVSSGTAGTITVNGSSTKQLTTQTAKTITPSTSAQTAVASGVYTTGAITVAAIPNNYEDVATETEEYTSLIDELESVVDNMSGGGGGVKYCTLEIVETTAPTGTELVHYSDGTSSCKKKAVLGFGRVQVQKNSIFSTTNCDFSEYNENLVSIPEASSDRMKCWFIKGDATAHVRSSTNLADPSSADWKNDERLSLGTGTTKACAGHITTNYIRANAGDILRVQGLSLYTYLDGYASIAGYSSNKTFISTQYAYIGATGATSPDGAQEQITLENGVYSYPLIIDSTGKQRANSSTYYIRLSGPIASGYTPDDIVITINKPIVGTEWNLAKPNATNTTDWDYWTNNARLGANGEYHEHLGGVVTNWIKAKPGDAFIISGLKISEDMTDSIIAYNANKEKVLGGRPIFWDTNGYGVATINSADQTLTYFKILDNSATQGIEYIRFGLTLTGSVDDVYITSG